MLKAHSRLFEHLALVTDLVLIAVCWLGAYFVRFDVFGHVAKPPFSDYALQLLPILVVWGVAYKDRPEDSQKFLSQLGDPYQRIAVDRDGRVAIDFGVYGVPETYVIDQQGRIRFRQVGPISPADWDQKLAPLLRQLAKS